MTLMCCGQCDKNVPDTMYRIKTVENSKDKELSYRENFKRYNRAKAFGFYFECLWILYAMLEDRTSAFLYYLGFTSAEKRSSVVGNKKIKMQIRTIFNMTDDGAQNIKYKFDTISGKLLRIHQVVVWSGTDTGEITDYQKVVKKAVAHLKSDKDFLDSLAYLNNEWRDKRNQLIHALFNKDPDTVGAELLPVVEKGYKAVRILDNAISRLKREKIRERFTI